MVPMEEVGGVKGNLASSILFLVCLSARQLSSSTWLSNKASWALDVYRETDQDWHDVSWFQRARRQIDHVYGNRSCGEPISAARVNFRALHWRVTIQFTCALSCLRSTLDPCLLRGPLVKSCGGLIVGGCGR